MKGIRPDEIETFLPIQIL